MSRTYNGRLLHESSVGDYGEGIPWALVAGSQQCLRWISEPCPHVGPSYTADVQGNPTVDGQVQYANVPCVVVAFNEGGYDCTEVCLDCVFDAAIKAGVIKGIVR